MAPRIIESEEDDEYDELAASGEDEDDDGDAYSEQAQHHQASSSRSKGKGRASAAAAAAAAAANGRRSTGAGAAGGRASTRIRVGQSQQAQAEPRGGGRRQAAIRANQSMDVDGAMPSEQDDEEEDEEEEEDELLDEDDAEADEDDDQDEDDDGAVDDAEGEDDELDELYAAHPQTASTGGHSPATSTTTNGPVTKIKLKFGQNATSNRQSSPLHPGVSNLKGKGRASTSTSSSESGSKQGKAVAAVPAKRKREQINEFDGTPDNEEDQEQPPEEDEEDEEDFFSDNKSEDSAVSMSKMTARQRAAAIGAEPELLELPQGPSKKKIFTADEVAMRKVETSRRRKHLLNKKLEEEKAETIERLLKKPVGGRRGATTSRLAAQTKVERPTEGSPLLTLPIQGGVDANGQVITPEQLAAQQVVRIPTSYRWVSSIRGGEYREIWAVPPNLEERFSWPTTVPKIAEVFSGQPKEVKYPPPRPPPKTRLLKQPGAVSVA